MKTNAKRILVLGVLALALATGFAQCKKEDNGLNPALLLLLGRNTTDCSAPTSGFVVFVPCGVAN